MSTVTSLKTTFVDHHRLRQQPTTSSSAVTSRCQSHFYAKICDDHHVYSKIWTSPDPGNSLKQFNLEAFVFTL